MKEISTGPSESQLIRLAADGDARAIRQLYDRYSPRVYAVVRRIAGDDDLAQDYAQEAWIRAIRALPTFRGDARFSTWLHRIAVNAALQALRNIEDMHPDRKLDVKRTVEETGRNAGIVIPHFLREQQDRTQVLLLLDNGGNSMWVHAQKVQTLFAKIKRRFPQDLKTFYFHNAVYDQVYEDEARRKPVTLRKVMENSPEYRVFIVGDAYMAPHELLSPFGSIEFREESSTPSLTNLKTLHEHFPYVVWINPTPKQYWNRTVAPYVQQVFKMEPLTINGILEAAKYMNGIKHF